MGGATCRNRGKGAHDDATSACFGFGFRTAGNRPLGEAHVRRQCGKHGRWSAYQASAVASRRKLSLRARERGLRLNTALVENTSVHKGAQPVPFRRAGPLWRAKSLDPATTSIRIRASIGAVHPRARCSPSPCSRRRPPSTTSAPSSTRSPSSATRKPPNAAVSARTNRSRRISRWPRSPCHDSGTRTAYRASSY